MLAEHKRGLETDVLQHTRVGPSRVQRGAPLRVIAPAKPSGAKILGTGSALTSSTARAAIKVSSTGDTGVPALAEKAAAGGKGEGKEG
jgi:hypothetical protein